MSEATLSKVTARKAAEVCKQVELGAEATALLRDDPPPRRFLDLLAGQKLYEDSCRFLAHALPKREAVWWACVCVRQLHGPKLAAPEETALKAAEKWVLDPGDANRRAALPPAEAAGMRTPAGCAAMAAFWSGGSLGPPNAPVVAPAPHLTGVAVAGAVQLAAVLTEPARAAEKLARAVELGIAVGNGASRWK